MSENLYTNSLRLKSVYTQVMKKRDMWREKCASPVTSENMHEHNLRLGRAQGLDLALDIIRDVAQKNNGDE